jgi:hypothetical protein
MALNQETRIDNYDAMMEANADLMSAVYNDAKMTPAEKLRNFSVGVRNQVMLSRDLAARRKELFGYGMKIDGPTKALMFDPTAEKAV